MNTLFQRLIPSRLWLAHDLRASPVAVARPRGL